MLRRRPAREDDRGHGGARGGGSRLRPVAVPWTRIRRGCRAVGDLRCSPPSATASLRRRPCWCSCSGWWPRQRLGIRLAGVPCGRVRSRLVRLLPDRSPITGSRSPAPTTSRPPSRLVVISLAVSGDRCGATSGRPRPLRRSATSTACWARPARGRRGRRPGHGRRRRWSPAIAGSRRRQSAGSSTVPVHGRPRRGACSTRRACSHPGPAARSTSRTGLPSDEYVAVPVRRGERTIGHFLVTATSRRRYPSWTLRIAVLLADQVAAALPES